MHHKEIAFGTNKDVQLESQGQGMESDTIELHSEKSWVSFNLTYP